MIASDQTISISLTTGSTKRLYEVDCLRVSAIVLVILYHTFTIFDKIEYNDTSLEYFKFFLDHVVSFFRLPLLIFVSGYMFSFLKIGKGKYNDTQKFIKSKFKRLILPYLVFAPLTLYLYSNYIYEFSIDKILCPIGHLWFIVMLFWCFCSVQFISKYIDLSKPKTAFSLVAILMLCYPLSFSISDYFGIGSLLKWLWCFMLGYISYSIKGMAYLRKMSSIEVMTLWIISALLIFGTNFIREYNLKVSILCHPLVMSICVITIWTTINSIGINHVSKTFNKIISCSYGMYVFHMWIIISSFLILDSKSINLPISLASGCIYFLFVVFSSFILSHLFLKTRFGKYLIG